MIAFLCGRVAAKLSAAALIDVQGVGYQVFLSGRALSRLPDVGQEAHILTHLQMRDDGPVLFGFLSQSERELFEKLISVSSVGPKVALSILSTYDPPDVVAAITAQDLGAIQRVPGVGKKMASRIVLELKESLGSDVQASLPGVSTAVLDARKAAGEALLSMGFTSEETELALKGAPEEASETVLLQYALKRLGA